MVLSRLPELQARPSATASPQPSHSCLIRAPLLLLPPLLLLLVVLVMISSPWLCWPLLLLLLPLLLLQPVLVMML